MRKKLKKTLTALAISAWLVGWGALSVWGGYENSKERKAQDLFLKSYNSAKFNYADVNNDGRISNKESADFDSIVASEMAKDNGYRLVNNEDFYSRGFKVLNESGEFVPVSFSERTRWINDYVDKKAEGGSKNDF